MIKIVQSFSESVFVYERYSESQLAMSQAPQRFALSSSEPRFKSDIKTCFFLWPTVCFTRCFKICQIFLAFVISTGTFFSISIFLVSSIVLMRAVAVEVEIFGSWFLMLFFQCCFFLNNFEILILTICFRRFLDLFDFCSNLS